jgi:hypothetical protein
MSERADALAPRWFWIALGLAAIPMVWAALAPPVAFDEILYHLPFVQAIARDGAVRFQEHLRFPVFPLLAELIVFPVYRIGGDVAPHFVSLLATLLTGVVMLSWARRRGIANGMLAAAAFLGGPIIVRLGTTFYVEPLLTLFVTLGFFALDREDDDRRWFHAGLALGAACSVKYLGLYFAAAALLHVRRPKDFVQYALGGAIVALPMYGWIYAQSGNPVFPFFGSSPWHVALPPLPSIGEWLTKFARIPWDVLFARDRIGQQPPFTPFFVIALVIVLWRRSSVTWIAFVYIVAFTFLPADSRYLVPMLPLLFLEAASHIPSLSRRTLAALTLLVLLPGPAYAIYRIVHDGPHEGFVERNLPQVRALRHAGALMRVYNCGAEELIGHAEGIYRGDHWGLSAYWDVLGTGKDAALMHGNLRARDLNALLVVKKRCPFLALPANGFTLLYEDETAQLWRVDP